MQQHAAIACPGPVEETITGWGQYSSHIPPLQSQKINALADLIVSSFAQSSCPPFRVVSIVGHADKDRHGTNFEDSVSFERATTVEKALTAAVKKLWDERNMGPPPVGGVDLARRGDGAKHMVAPAYSSANRRVVVTVSRKGAPPTAKKKVIEITAKSFIALIGGRVGSIPGLAIVTPPYPLPPVVPVPRQKLLELLAKATDANFNEDPRSIAKDKKYRLFSSCRFEVVFDKGGNILAAIPSPLDTDVGTEGPLQPPALEATAVTVSPKGDKSVSFSWFGKGRPHALAEPAFQEVLPRTSVFIWHFVEGKIEVSGDMLVTTVTIRGSQFPSHRVFVDGRLAPGEQVQGPFSNLWVADSSDSRKVQ